MEPTRHKYESDATMDLVYHQIEQALEKMDSSSLQNQEKIKAILRRYVEGGSALTRRTMSFWTESSFPCLRGAACPPRSRPPQRTRSGSKIR